MKVFKLFRKSLAGLTIAALASAFVVAPSADAQSLNFTDSRTIPSWAIDAISSLVSRGVISGNSDGSFAPYRDLARAEVSKIIVLSTGIPINTRFGPHFSDVPQDAWFYQYVETMYNKGWINGYDDGLFRPANVINRAEISKMLVNAYDIEQIRPNTPSFVDVPSGAWFYPYVETAVANKVMSSFGNGTFRPETNVNRAATAVMVYNAELLSNNSGNTADGALEVRVSRNTPQGSNIPFNATAIPYTTLEFSASDARDVQISSIVVTRSGLGNNADFDKVWAEVDGFRVGNSSSVNNRDEAKLRFSSPIVISAGQTIEVDIVASGDDADASNAGHHNRLGIKSSADITSTASNIVGSFAMYGNQMEIAAYEVAQVKFTPRGTDSSISVGETEVNIGEFSLKADSDTKKSIEVRSITFKNTSTADLQETTENLGLYVSNELVSTRTIFDGDYITFILDNGATGGYILERSRSTTFDILADIITAEASDKIVLQVRDSEDIVAIEVGTGFGVRATSTQTGCTLAEGTCATLKEYTLETGDLNISRARNAETSATAAPGQTEIVLLDAKVTVEQPVRVDDGFRLYLNNVSGVSSASQFNDTFNEYTLQTGSGETLTADAITGNIDSTSGFTNGEVYVEFEGSFDLSETTTLRVTANIQNDEGLTNRSASFKADRNSFRGAEYNDDKNDQALSTAKITGSVTGATISVKDSELQVTRSDSDANGQNVVAGDSADSHIELLEFTISNSDSRIIEIKNMTFELTGKGSANGRDASSDYGDYTINLYEGNIKKDGRTPGRNGSVTLSGLDINIPANADKTFTVVADINQDAGKEISGAVSSSSGHVVGDILTTIGVRAFPADINLQDGDKLVVGANEMTVNAAYSTGNTVSIESFTVVEDMTDGDRISLINSIQIALTDIEAKSGGNDVYINGATVASPTFTPITGADYNLVDAGRLTAKATGFTEGKILVGDDREPTEILKLNLSASYDNVTVSELWFENNTDTTYGLSTSPLYNATTAAATSTPVTVGRATNITNAEYDAAQLYRYFLYNSAGNKIAEAAGLTSEGYIRFNLGSSPITIGQSRSQTYSVRAQSKSVNNVNSTNKELKLALASASNYERNTSYQVNYGIKAKTAATGQDIKKSSAGAWGAFASNGFVNHKSAIVLKHAPSQPGSFVTGTPNQQLYRFTATADGEQADLARMTLRLNAGGNLRFNATPTFAIQRVNSTNGNLVGALNDIATVTATGATTTQATITIDFTDGTSSDSDAGLTLNDIPSTFAILSTTNLDKDGTGDDNFNITATMVNTESNTFAANDTLENQETLAPSIIWSDASDDKQGDNRTDWFNGFNIDFEANQITNKQ